MQEASAGEQLLQSQGRGPHLLVDHLPLHPLLPVHEQTPHGHAAAPEVPSGEGTAARPSSRAPRLYPGARQYTPPRAPLHASMYYSSP